LDDKVDITIRARHSQKRNHPNADSDTRPPASN
jgi:hypothetical protein